MDDGLHHRASWAHELVPSLLMPVLLRTSWDRHGLPVSPYLNVPAARPLWSKICTDFAPHFCCAGDHIPQCITAYAVERSKLFT